MPSRKLGLKNFYCTFLKGSFYTVIEATVQRDAEIYAETYWPGEWDRIFSSGQFRYHRQKNTLTELPHVN